jgi:N6-adenosine-specific RNA methylase IME4
MTIAPKRGRPPIEYGTIETGPFAGLPRHGFNVISADPPWHHHQYSAKGFSRHPSRHYDTMPIADIKALPVDEVASKNCFLFLWTTWPHLEQALEVMKAWNFKYSSSFLIWAKLNPKAGSEMFLTERSFALGTGYTSRKGTEPMLIGRRGRPEILVKPRELLLAARREHSRKPDESYSRVEKFAHGPRLELFSRQPRDNWVTWGNQTEKFAEAPAYQPIRLTMPDAAEPDEAGDDLAIPQFIRRLAT